MILYIDPLTVLRLNLNFSENVIIGSDGPYEGLLAPMVDIRNYNFTYLADKIVKLKKYFINSYHDICLKYESVISSTQRMHRILDHKYEKGNLNKVIAEQCHHTNDVNIAD